MIFAANSGLEELLQKLSGGHRVPLIPPTFDGSRAGFAWVLFSLTLTIALIIAATVGSMRNAWHQRKFTGWRDPINVNRYILWLMAFAMVMGGTPDIMVFLAYGEVSPMTLNILLELDRVLDGMVVFPTAAAVSLWYRAKPVINYQLVRQPIPVELWPTFRQMIPSIRIGLIVMFIALGVAIGK